MNISVVRHGVLMHVIKYISFKIRKSVFELFKPISVWTKSVIFFFQIAVFFQCHIIAIWSPISERTIWKAEIYFTCPDILSQTDFSVYKYLHCRLSGSFLRMLKQGFTCLVTNYTSLSIEIWKHIIPLSSNIGLSHWYMSIQFNDKT